MCIYGEPHREQIIRVLELMKAGLSVRRSFSILDQVDLPQEVLVQAFAPGSTATICSEGPLPSQEGFLVLDASDPQHRTVGATSGRQVSWYSSDPRNPLVLDHLDRGGDACLLSSGAIYLHAGTSQVQVVEIDQVPMALAGASEVGVGCALTACAAAVALEVPLELVRRALESTLEPHERFVLGGAHVLLVQTGDEDAIESHLRMAADLPAERRQVLCLNPGTQWAPAVEAVSDLAGLQHITGPLDQAISGLVPGDLLLVLEAQEASGSSELLRSLSQLGWQPGDPVCT